MAQLVSDQQAVGETPPSRTDDQIEEIRTLLDAYRNFDTSTRTGLQAYFDSIREIPQPRPDIETLYMTNDLPSIVEPVRLVFCETPEQVSTWTYIRRSVSRLPYKKSPGRDIKILVYYGDRILGIIGLSSPVVNLGVRDKFLAFTPGLKNGQKGSRLLEGMDMTTCVGIQPWASRHNGGKLLAILATSHEVAAYYFQKYSSHGEGNWKSTVKEERIPLRWITTTSLYGESVQYDRLYKFLGETKGFGHIHITDSVYKKMMSWLSSREEIFTREEIGNRFGDGASARMRRISTFLRRSGLVKKGYNLQHKQRRGVYIHMVQEKSAEELFRWWHERWCRQRLARQEEL